MMMIACCDHCGKELQFKFGDIQYALNLVKWKGSCKTCYHELEEEGQFSFCSLACLQIFASHLVVREMPKTAHQKNLESLLIDQSQQHPFSIETKKVKKDQR